MNTVNLFSLVKFFNNITPESWVRDIFDPLYGLLSFKSTILFLIKIVLASFGTSKDSLFLLMIGFMEDFGDAVICPFTVIFSSNSICILVYFYEVVSKCIVLIFGGSLSLGPPVGVTGFPQPIK